MKSTCLPREGVPVRDALVVSHGPNKSPLRLDVELGEMLGTLQGHAQVCSDSNENLRSFQDHTLIRF